MLTISYTSEFSLLCALSPPATLSNQQRLWQFAKWSEGLPDVQEAVVGMNNLTLFFFSSPDTTIIKTLLEQWEALQHQSFQDIGRLIEIPVHYGGEVGLDLAAVAQFHRCSPEEIIRRHTEPTYTVFMIGFQPGFPYLGGLPHHLHTPRHAKPRAKVPAGAVGIGGEQTGIYPFSSPGGWQLIGQTSIPLFDANKEPPVLLQAGDKVKFFAERIEL
ncbi:MULTISPECIES: 5-oxoprolinase subunit PxpB [Rodentibacter]|uniref:5-oxoprolinase subunit PxpB n=1 Tax=Rodentibacter TaxID=1960084 RepID=UPI001CFDFF5C|nr:5-oxoprolinase subunit PxpB [Rodentibacter sp. JRC1]GJI56881.1 hypothetical protein HEMROJRC1_19930 [Rodentibacter sp. JRC1]